ncbi:MAG: inner membrane CreD family protein [Bacillota bacterium]
MTKKIIPADLLTILYGYLYVLLQNQDYAMFIGGIGIFAIMAAVMYMSRKVDWYKIELGGEITNVRPKKQKGRSLPPGFRLPSSFYLPMLPHKIIRASA